MLETNLIKAIDKLAQKDSIALAKLLHRKLSAINFSQMKKKSFLERLQLEIDHFDDRPSDYINASAVKRIKAVGKQIISGNSELTQNVSKFLSKRTFDSKNKTIKVDVAIHKKFSNLKNKGDFSNASELLQELIEVYKNSR